MSEERRILRYWGIHGCVTALWWGGLLALVTWWAGKEYGLW